MPRLFIAIEIPTSAEIHSLFVTLKKTLNSSSINWVEEQNLHITLKYLGETHSENINPIKDLLSQISCHHSEFSIIPGILWHFGSQVKPFTLCHLVEPCLELATLHQEIEDSACKMGFKPENHAFTPHFTLARVKQLKEMIEFKKLLMHSSPITTLPDIRQFSLMESTLFAKGPVYKTLERFEFSKKE
jgi:2'-5' RNA ligase